MGWRTVYIENGQKISLYLNNLKLEDGDERYTIPIEDIDMLLINSYKMYMTTQLMCKLSQANVCVIICNKQQLPECVFHPFTGNYAAYRMQDAQINLAPTARGLLWQRIIQNKIGNQIAVLDKHSGECITLETMQEFQRDLLPDDTSNREGLAAKMYFKGLYGVDFSRDREADDCINLALNYGYTILRAAIARSVVEKGFIPTIGIHHHNIYNHFNLADDFMEPYRPLIDDWVYKNMKDEFFTREKRLSLLDNFNNKIFLGEKKYTILQSITYYLDAIVRAIKQEDYMEGLLFPGVDIVEECE